MDYDIISAVLRFYEKKSMTSQFSSVANKSMLTSLWPCVIVYESIHMPDNLKDALLQNLVRIGYEHMEITYMDELAFNPTCDDEEITSSLRLLNLTIDDNNI